MNPESLKIIIIGVIFTGVFVLAPIISALLRHQQRMTELLSKSNIESSELKARIVSLEQRLAGLETRSGSGIAPETELPSRLSL